MRIIFFYPDYQERIGNSARTELPPLGMLHVCAVAEQLGLQVQVFPVHEETDPESVPEADIFAYSITATVTYPIFTRLAPLIRHKSAIQIAGNTHANIFPERTLAELELDAVFTGEGEVSVRSWLANGCKETGIIQGSQVDINAIPFPARHLLPQSKVLLNQRVGGAVNNVATIYSARGCIYSCAYCGNLNNGTSRLKFAERFDQEIASIRSLHPQVAGLTVLDELFTFNSAHALEIASVIQSHNLPWECTTRADFLRRDVVEALVSSDCREVKLGMETGSQEMLNRMNKRLDLNKARRSILRAAELGLPIKLFIMHGFPGENAETTQETISFLTELKDALARVVLYRFSPVPGSPIYGTPEVIHHDWTDYSIYQNNQKWWGSDRDFQVVNDSYQRLRDQIIHLFGKVN